MKAPILLHIPEPCHENWDAMTPQDKGRHCQSCNKIVVDFSVMTDRQVLDYLKNAKGNTCGRFYNDQLQRPLIEPQKQPSKWNYFVASIASFFVSVKLIAQGSALQGKVANPYGQSVSPSESRQVKGEVRSVDTKTISGKVVDEKGAAIAGASIKIGKAAKGTISDNDGSFAIRCNVNDELTFMAIGMENKKIKVNSLGDKCINLKIVLQANVNEIMGDIEVVSGWVSPSYYYDRHSTPIYDVKGIVTDENYNAIKDATITVFGISSKAKTDYSGEFEIENIKKSNLKTLNITAKGYKTKSIVITNKILDEIEDLKIVLEKEINNSVSGKVVDEKGAAIATAIVKIGAATKGIMTNGNGEFVLENVKEIEKQKIIISAVGCINKTIDLSKLDNKYKNLIIRMAIDTTLKIDNFITPHGHNQSYTIRKQLELEKFNNSLIKGKITDEKNTSIAGASITIKGTKIGSVSNADGRFELNKLGNNTKLTIVISSIGYETKTMEIESKNLKNDLNIILKTQSQNLDEIVLNSSDVTINKRFYGGAVSIVSRCTITEPSIVKKAIIKPIQKLLKIQPVKVYPNPATKNATLHIAIKDAGEYQLHLFDMQSRLLLVKQITVTANNQITDLQLPDNITSGNYFIQFINQKSKKQFTEKIIVQ